MSNSRSVDNDGLVLLKVGGVVAGLLGSVAFISVSIFKIENHFHNHFYFGASAEAQKAEPKPVQPPPKPAVRQAPPAPTGLAGGTGLKEPPTTAARKTPPTGEAISRPVPPAQDAVAGTSPNRNLLVDKPASVTPAETSRPNITAAVPVPSISVESVQATPAREAEPVQYFIVELVPETVPAPAPKQRPAAYPNHGHGYKEVRDRHPDGSTTWNYVCPDCGQVLVRSSTRLSLPGPPDRRSIKLARRD